MLITFIVMSSRLKKTIYITLIILIVITLKMLSVYEVKYFKELRQARELFHDNYSLQIFDKMVYLYNVNAKYKKGDCKYKALTSPYTENINPLVSINKGDVLIDAGVSEWLYFTILFSDAVGKNGKVIGFEPDLTVIDKIQKELKKDNIENVTVYPVGLWNEQEVKKMYLKNNLGSSVSDSKDSDKSINVKLVKLDDFAKQNKINKIDFIKMDIEGAELEALQGSKNILCSQKPNMAISINHNPEDLFRIVLYLNSLNIGYKYWLGWHAPDFNNVVLYATAKN